MQNSDFCTRITKRSVSQASPDIFCMQISMISIKITSLYGSQPLCVVFTCKTATFGHELLDSIGPSPLLWFFHSKQRLLDQHTGLYGYQTSPVVSCIQNSMISTRNTSFYGFQSSFVVLCIQNSVISTWITSLYWSQPSCVAFGCKTATFGLE